MLELGVLDHHLKVVGLAEEDPDIMMLIQHNPEVAQQIKAMQVEPL